MFHFLCRHLLQRIKIFAGFFEPVHDQSNGAAADFVTAAAIIIGYATLTHIYDSKNCSTVLHNRMLLSRIYYEKTIPQQISAPMFRSDTPVEQHVHTVSSESLTPIGRNLHKPSFFKLFFCFC